MRLLIKNKDDVFQTLFERTGLTRGQLAKIIGVSYWTLKHWLRDYTVPEKYFIKLSHICPEIEDIAICEKLPDNWGAVKGGKISFCKKSRYAILKQAERARNGIIYKFKSPPFNRDFCEFYGILLGDGCVFKFFVKSENRTRYSVSVSGNSINDLEYFKNNILPLVNRLFGLSPSIIYYSSCNGIRIDIRYKVMADVFLKLGFPLGKKKELSIPNKILNSGMININRTIRGLFDTDGCFFARKDENYLYPHIMITSYSANLRNQLVEILKRQNFRPYIHSTNVVIRGKKNIIKWFGKIGSSHPQILNRYKTWKLTGRLLPKGP